MRKKFIFLILLFLTVFGFILDLFKIPNLETSSFPIFPPVYNGMNVVLDIEKGGSQKLTEVKSNQVEDFDPKDVILKTNNGFFSFSMRKNVLNKALSGKVSGLEILVADDFEHKINGIIIFNEIKTRYFKDFSTFEKEKTELCPDSVCKNYTKYKIPNEEIKYNKNSKSINFHTLQNAICTIVLSLFSGKIIFNYGIFLLPYILLCSTIIYYIKNKDRINLFKENFLSCVKPCYITVFIFLFACLMFSNGIFDYLPWVDEYRTIEYSSPKMPLSTLFSDPGNPPVFYALFRIFISIFGISIYTMKIFPFLISIGALFALWVFLKDRIDLKTANLAVFLASINVPFVYYSLETRCYILQMLMTPLLALVLFKILTRPKKKYYIFYAILTAIASNIHYYEILLLFSNFVFAALFLILQKRRKEILPFFLANAIGAAFFLPFFLSTAYSEALSNSSFNNWIPPINFNQIVKCTFYLFGGFLSLLLSASMFVLTLFKRLKTPKNADFPEKTRQNVIIYCFFAIIFTILQGVILSYTIRPMLVERYLVLLSPLFMAFLACLISANHQKKWIFILFLIWVFAIQGGSFEKNNRRKGLIELPMSFSRQFYEQNGGKIYAIINFSNPEYLENREDYIKEGITYISRSVFAIDEAIDEIFKKDKNAIIFTNMINPNEKSLQLPNNYKCYFNSSIDMCLWKIEGEENENEI